MLIEPVASARILNNPGVGFFAYPALEDASNPLLQEGLYRFAPDAVTYNHPDSRTMFVSSRWAHIEKEEGRYDWSGLERQLDQVLAGGRVACLRVAPYALGTDDVPAWLRRRNPQKPDFPFWQIDPNRSDYAACWARFIHRLGQHVDGRPGLMAVDMAIVGAWGEGGGTEFMRPEALQPIVQAYMDSFHVTPLLAQLHDPASVRAINALGRNVGIRMDCLGDMGGFHGKKWSHMLDFYPQNIVNFGMAEAWKKAPVCFEACWTMQDWFRAGWDLDYIIDESLKWHISCFANKGTPVPEAWREKTTRWLNRMGYRYELRRAQIAAGDSPLRLRTHWVNVGAAPCYAPYRLIYQLTDAGGRQHTQVASADIRAWLPGEDHLAEDVLTPPAPSPQTYRLAVGIDTGIAQLGMIDLAVEGCRNGFFPLGDITL